MIASIVGVVVVTGFGVGAFGSCGNSTVGAAKELVSSPTSYVELSFVSRYEPSSIVIFLAVAKASLKVKVNFVIVPDVSDVAA